MADKIEIIQHIANLTIVSGIPMKNRTEKQQTAYSDSLEFVRQNIVSIYEQYYQSFEKEFANHDIGKERIISALDFTAGMSNSGLVPERYVLIDAINRVRTGLSTISGLLEESSTSLEYFENEHERLSKVLALLINTDKGWIADAFAKILQDEATNKKLSELRWCVDVLTLRHEMLDKEYRALSRMLGAIIDDEIRPERPRVVHSQNPSFTNIVEKQGIIDL